MYIYLQDDVFLSQVASLEWLKCKYLSTSALFITLNEKTKKVPGKAHECEAVIFLSSNEID